MENSDTHVIPGASYLVYEYSPTKFSSIMRIPGQVAKKSKTVTFYTFDGTPITTIEHNFEFEKMNSMLDCNAPAPKPFSYKRIWMPAFKISHEQLIVEAGYVVLFHDKDGYRISWEVLNTVDEDILSWPEYDFSEAVEEESDFSLKDVDMDLIEDDQEELDQNFSLTDTQINFSRKTKIDFGLSGINFDLSKSNMTLSRINNTMTLSRINFAVNEMETLIKEKEEAESHKDETEKTEEDETKKYEDETEKSEEDETEKHKDETEKSEEHKDETEEAESSCILF